MKIEFDKKGRATGNFSEGGSGSGCSSSFKWLKDDSKGLQVYSDAKDVAQNLLNNKAVVINFSRMEDDSARRIVDFITGTVYALNGEIQRIGDRIFLATPPKFVTDGKISDLVDKKDNLS